MQHVLDEVDKLVSELASLKPISPENQKKLDEKFRLEFNYNSNHLEGNTLTYSETQLLLIFDDTKGSHSMREYEEMKAHDVAFKMVEELAKDNERPLTEQNIKNLNETILVRPFWKDAITPDGQSTRRQIKVGNYKEHPNSVRLSNGELFEYASPDETQILMQELIDWYRSEENALHPVTLAAMLHYKFVRIHPFDDGNGRIARLLMNYILMRKGLPPVVIKSADKKNYLRVLHLADVGNNEPFIKYIAEQLVWSSEISIKATKGLNVEEPDDLDKKISLLEKDLQTIDAEEEVKKELNKLTFKEIYTSWVTLLLTEVIPVVQKFNKFFTNTSHQISITNDISLVGFIDEPVEGIISKLKSNVNEKLILIENPNIQEIRFNAQYGAFIKGGLNTFGCNYGFRIKFSIYKYEIYVDGFSDSSQSKSEKVFERLLHKPLVTSEIKDISDKLGNAILNHITYYVKKNGIL